MASSATEPALGEATGARDEASDEELAGLAMAGDELALDALLRRFRPVAAQIARRYFLPGSDPDDVIQEGMIGLYKAVCGFDPGRGQAFGPFAALCIKRQIFTAMTAAGRRKNEPLNRSVPLLGADGTGEPHAFGHSGRSGTDDPADAVLAHDGARDLARFCRKALTDLEREVLVRYVAGGQDHAGIAAAVGRSTKAVDNALQRIRRKITTVYLAAS